MSFFSVSSFLAHVYNWENVSMIFFQLWNSWNPGCVCDNKVSRISILYLGRSFETTFYITLFLIPIKPISLLLKVL